MRRSFSPIGPPPVLPDLPLVDSSAVRLAAADLEAVFLPRYGMLGASLRHRGVELLGRVENLEASAASGSTAGIPLLHPWANRLSSLAYRAAGKEVRLDPSSPLLHFDSQGLPIHGVPWGKLPWDVTGSSASGVTARLEWTREDLLTVFPFPHRLDMRAELTPDALAIETTLTPRDQPVPVTFGFHPYVRIPGAPRSTWRLRLPDMRRYVLDASGIPTGAEEPFAEFDALLADRSWDDGFELADDGETFEISGSGAGISVELG